MQALLDADLVAYRCAASAEGESEEVALLRVDKLMRQLLEETNADSYRAFLTGTSNFRKEIDPNYKANRTAPPPQWLQHCREFLVREWKAEVADHVEADDLLGISQTTAHSAGQDTCIVSLDKDLLMIPGTHYQWGISTPKWTKEAKWYDVSDLEGLRSFYISSLVGDKTDNIFGVDGLGKVKSSRILADLGTEQEMFDRCRELYSNDERFFRNLKLLWIFRRENDIFSAQERGLINE